MKTFAEIQTYIQNRFNDTSTKTQTRIQELLEINYQWFKTQTGWPFEETSYSTASVANQSNYRLPIDFFRLTSVIVRVASVDYVPKPIYDMETCNNLISGSSANAKSDQSLYFTIINDEILFYPTFSSATATITLRYYVRGRDLISGDFTDKVAGTVTATLASTAIVGAGTAFAATDVGRYIKVDNNGFWYRIATFTNVTNITISRPYTGATVAGATYTIGTVPIYPEEAAPIIAWKTLQELWEDREDFSPTGGKANYYKIKVEEGMKEFMKRIKNQVDNPEVYSLDENNLPPNINDYPENLS